MRSQIGHRWLREQHYVEDGIVDVATRVQVGITDGQWRTDKKGAGVRYVGVTDGQWRTDKKGAGFNGYNKVEGINYVGVTDGQWRTDKKGAGFNGYNKVEDGGAVDVVARMPENDNADGDGDEPLKPAHLLSVLRCPSVTPTYLMPSSLLCPLKPAPFLSVLHCPSVTPETQQLRTVQVHEVHTGTMTPVAQTTIFIEEFCKR